MQKIMGLVLVGSLLVGFTAPQAKAQRFKPLDPKVFRAAQHAAEQQEEKQILARVENAFEYDDIIHALYRAYSFYTQVHREPLNQKLKKDQQAYMAQKGILPLEPDSTLKRKPLSIHSKPGHFLSQVAQNKVDDKTLLDALGPLDPVKSSWEDSLHAARYFSSYVQVAAKRTKSFEKFLRHAQMRILFRISQTDTTAQMKDSLQADALGQLRIALVSTHLVYERVFGEDALLHFKPEYPYSHYIGEIVVLAKGGAKAQDTQAKREQSTGPNVYELEKRAFLREITYWRSKLSQDPHSFTQTLEALKSRNRTSHFSFAKASGELASSFLFIDAIKSVGDMVFATGEEQTPLSNLRMLSASAVEYDLLQHDFAHVKTIVAALEPEKLADNKYGGVFKNADLYQGTQSTIAEIFNTIYLYAVTPGRTPQEWTQVMNLLADFSNPHHYSIMTRLAAIAVAAKILDIRDQALSPHRPNENTAAAQAQKLNHEKPVLPGTPGWKQPANYNDYMARNIVDIYATLVAHGQLAGMQDYGLQPAQIKALADNLARLYNIFANGTSQAYPRILPPNQANVEQVWTVENGMRVQKLHTFGNRVKTSWGETVEMNLNTSIDQKYKFEKDAGEFVAQFAVDVVSWKFLVSSIRLGKKAVGAAMRFVNPVRSTGLVARNAVESASSLTQEPLSLKTALKKGINPQGPQASELKNMLEHPLPEISEIKTYEDALKAVGLKAGADKREIRRAANQLSLRYSRDKVEAIASPRGILFAEDQAKRANNIREMLLKGKPSAGKSRMNTAPKTHAEEVYEAAAEQAAKGPVRKVDPNSLKNIAIGFSQFYALDYVLSFANEPLQDGLIENAQQSALNSHPAAKFGDKQKTKENPQEQPLQFINDIAAKAQPQRLRSAALFMLPINVVRKLEPSIDVLGKDGNELFKGSARTLSFVHAVNAGNVKQFTQQIDTILKDLDRNRLQSFEQEKNLLRALPGSKRELNTAYSLYKEQIKPLKQVAQTDLTQAQKDLNTAAENFINANADIMSRVVKAYVKKQKSEDIKNSIFAFKMKYGNFFTLQDANDLKAAFTRYYNSFEQAALLFYTAPQQALRTGKDPNLVQQQASSDISFHINVLNVFTQQFEKKLEERATILMAQDPLKVLPREIQDRIERDMQVMYPADIEEYPEALDTLEYVFNMFLRQTAILFQTAENIDEFEKGYQELVQQRNLEWIIAKKYLIDLGYGDLFKENR